MIPRATWKVADPNPRHVERLAEELALSSVVAACLVNRGFEDTEKAREFMNPRLSELTPPEGLTDLDQAARRLVRALVDRETIGVFGDYDVDGITSAALVYSFLKEVGATVVPFIADRFEGGYGFGESVVDSMKGAGCSLIVLLDCGTSDHDAVRRAKAEGMEVIIIDHHKVEGEHPEALAFVNPQRTDSNFPDRTMAAVGLAFYFVAAVRTRMVEDGKLSREKVDPRRLLDLVALGTVADVVPLVGNNRIFVSNGLKYLAKNRRAGLSALMKGSRIRTRNLRSDHISYQLAPRLNAAGRLARAKEAFDLLVCTEQSAAQKLAERLEQLTQERRLVEERVSREAREQIHAMGLDSGSVIVVGEQGWHRGVLGIVAARLSEEFAKPTYVVGFDGPEGVGSARGQGQLNLFESLAHCSEHLFRFGGHGDAAGFTVSKGGMDDLRECLEKYAEAESVSVKDDDLVCDGSLSPRQLDSKLLGEISRLGPFGNGNPEPVFEVSGLDVLGGRVVGGDHLKLELKTPTGTISAFGPRMGSHAGGLPQMVKVAAALCEDEWKGGGQVELRLVCPPVPDQI